MFEGLGLRVQGLEEGGPREERRVCVWVVCVCGGEKRGSVGGSGFKVQGRKIWMRPSSDENFQFWMKLSFGETFIG